MARIRRRGKRSGGEGKSVRAVGGVAGFEGADDELSGLLNIYSRSAEAFDSFDEGFVLLYATAASMAINNASRWRQSRATVEQLQRALVSRSGIDQAKGVFRVLYGVDEEAAFTMLRTQSQELNVTLRNVAREVLDAVRLTEWTPPPPTTT